MMGAAGLSWLHAKPAVRAQTTRSRRGWSDRLLEVLRMKAELGGAGVSCASTLRPGKPGTSRTTLALRVCCSTLGRYQQISQV